MISNLGKFKSDNIILESLVLGLELQSIAIHVAYKYPDTVQDHEKRERIIQP